MTRQNPMEHYNCALNNGDCWYWIKYDVTCLSTHYSLATLYGHIGLSKHWLNYCLAAWRWHIINGVLWPAPKTNNAGSVQYVNLKIGFGKSLAKLLPHTAGANEVSTELIRNARHTLREVRGEITYPLPNINVANIEMKWKVHRNDFTFGVFR